MNNNLKYREHEYYGFEDDKTHLSIVKPIKKETSKVKFSLKKLLSSIVYLIILSLTIGVFTKIYFEQQSIITSSQMNLDTYNKKIENGKKKNLELKNKERALDSDKSIEDTARNKYGMVRPGEKIIFDINNCKK